MNERIKKLLNFLLIFGTLAIVLAIGLGSGETESMAKALRSVSWRWLLLCFGAYAAFMLIDAFSIWHFVKSQGCRLRFRSCLYISLMGFYYSGITPGASGGQPFQIYYLQARRVPVGIGLSALTAKFFCFQLALQIAATFFCLCYGDFIREMITPYGWILKLGYAYNAGCLLLVLLLALNAGLVMKLTGGIAALGNKLGLIKYPERLLDRTRHHVSLFQSSLKQLIVRPSGLCIQLLVGFGELAAQAAILVFLYHAFQLSGIGSLKVGAMGVMQYLSAAYTPLPGASGAQEGVFALYFSRIFPDGIRFMALLLWRFFSYYLLLIVGALLSVSRWFLGVFWLRDKKKHHYN